MRYATAIGIGVLVAVDCRVFYERPTKNDGCNIDSVRRIHTIVNANKRRVMMPTELRSVPSFQAGHGVCCSVPDQGDSG